MKKLKPKNKKTKKKKRSIKSFPVAKKKRKYVWLNVLPNDLWLKVLRGQTIWEALQKVAVDLDGDCGGLGKCGKCKIKVLSSIGPPSEETKELLDQEELKEGIRLACRTKIRKDILIHIASTDQEQEYYQILKTGERPPIYLDPLISKMNINLPSGPYEDALSDFDRIKLSLGPEYRNLTVSLQCLRTLPEMLKNAGSQGTVVMHENYLMAWQKRETADHSYGLVFDLGTSTLVGKLINLLDGGEIVAISRLNSQIRFGTNIISRLKYIKEHRRGLLQLHEMLVKDLNSITRRLLEVEELDRNDIFVAVVAGNTMMQHLLLAVDPLGIAGAPFTPVLTDGLTIKAADIGIQLHPEALVYVMPTRSGYIGGDLISAIIASGAAEQEKDLVLGLDLGTNGEIFLGNQKRFMTCSAAAGPAFEGAKINNGMIAKTGAIEGVRIESDHLQYQVIGNIKPKGICGSGLADLVAVLLHCGIINHEGLILPPSELAEEALAARIIEREGLYHFLVASPDESNDRRQIVLTQQDVRELQLAKGAVAAGIQTLMDEMDIRLDDIDRLYLAGALGNYINPYSAIRIGLIPQVVPEIIKSLGNAASTGASMVLLSKSYWQMVNELAKTIEHVELSSRTDFNQYFIEQLDFPIENIW